MKASAKLYNKLHVMHSKVPLKIFNPCGSQSILLNGKMTFSFFELDFCNIQKWFSHSVADTGQKLERKGKKKK